MEVIEAKKIINNSTAVFNRAVQIILFASAMILAGSSTALAQKNILISIKGRVVNNDTGQPLEYVNVFLSNTTIGTTTGKNGEFVINNIPPGSYDIVFSYIGFETQKQHFQAFKQETLDYNISLTAKPLNYSPVEIIGKVPEDWKKNIDRFKKALLGNTDNADETKILNPEVINFSEVKGSDILKAYTDSVLKIENRSLGYMIYVNLDTLYYNKSNGAVKYLVYSRFQDLVPSSRKDSANWHDNRLDTYLDSPRYFFYLLVHRQLFKKDFSLYEGPFYRYSNQPGTKISERNLDITTEDFNVYTLNFSGILKVEHNSETSILNFYNPTTSIDKNGNFLTSYYTVQIEGYWGNQGMADQLPLNYVYTGD